MDANLIQEVEAEISKRVILEDRIRKARQILMPLSDKDSRAFVLAMVRRALAALDGERIIK